MVKTYRVGGMGCEGCKQTVENALSGVAGVTSASVDLKKSEAVLETEKPVGIIELQEALSEAGLYFIMDKDYPEPEQDNSLTGQKKKDPFFKKFLKTF